MAIIWITTKVLSFLSWAITFYIIFWKFQPNLTIQTYSSKNITSLAEVMKWNVTATLNILGRLLAGQNPEANNEVSNEM